MDMAAGCKRPAAGIAAVVGVADSCRSIAAEADNPVAAVEDIATDRSPGNIGHHAPVEAVDRERILQCAGDRMGRFAEEHHRIEVGAAERTRPDCCSRKDLTLALRIGKAFDVDENDGK